MRRCPTNFCFRQLLPSMAELGEQARGHQVHTALRNSERGHRGNDHKEAQWPMGWLKTEYLFERVVSTTNEMFEASGPFDRDRRSARTMMVERMLGPSKLLQARLEV